MSPLVPVRMLARQFVTEMSDALLAIELPGLPTERRDSAAEFTAARVAGMPSPIRLGVAVVAVLLGVSSRLLGTHRVVRTLARRPLPVTGDFVRLLRSLGFAYVWEHWPATAADGTPR